MGFKYFLFHASVHLALIGLIYFALDLTIFQLLLVFLSSAAIDADHLPFIMSHGIKHWLIVWDTHESKAYPLHNFLTIAIFSAGAVVAFLPQFFTSPQFFIFGICSLSVSLHLIWDLFEDAVIFKMGVKHWMCLYAYSWD